MSGEVEEISDNIREVMTCPVCLLLTGKLLSFCPNGHTLCEDCMIKLWTRNREPTCPLCRSALSVSPHLAITAVKIAEVATFLNIACSNRRYGCTDLLTVHEMVQHEAQCPYKPDVRCMVTACQWIGVYHELYEHVGRFHSNTIVETTERKNRLIVYDVNTIASNRHLAYLFRSADGMFWVLLYRESRNRIRVGVFKVINKDTRGSYRDHMAMTYRIIWNKVLNSKSWPQKQIRFRTVGSSLSLLNDARGDSRSYTIIWSTTSRVDIYWYFSGSRTASHYRPNRNA